MKLSALDWWIIAATLGLSLVIGLVASRKAGQSSRSFFLAGGGMPWWLLGVSMVATTFAIDTPNLVTGLVRDSGVAGNWVWWAFLFSGLVTTFVYARLWRRSGVTTDIEFYELRYGGQPAAVLRGFRAAYLALVFNVVVMGAVTLAAVKLGALVLGWEGWKTVLIGGSVTLIYSSLGGLRAVVLTDFVQFIIAMAGSIWAAVAIVGHESVGGLEALLSHENVQGKLDMLPPIDDSGVWITLLLVPLAVQWWASYYPGAEPGGGGYIAQRMFSAKSENQAMGAVLFFNVAHYALRPWPWILIALASLVMYPTDPSLAGAFADGGESALLSADKIKGDLAYPAMLTHVDHGLLGLVIASLLAAYMSTMSTQVNLGASYLVNDFWARFIKPDATEKQRVFVGRIATAVSIVLGSLLGLAMTDAGQAFNILLLLGAGTGAIYILRWFWWRINAMVEIVAMISSLVVASTLEFAFDKEVFESHEKLLIGVAITTPIWVLTAFFTRPETDTTLQRFVDVVRPGGPGWSRFTPAEADGRAWPVPRGILCALVACFAVYAVLFGTGNLIYGAYVRGAGLLAIACALSVLVVKLQASLQTPVATGPAETS